MIRRVLPAHPLWAPTGLLVAAFLSGLPEARAAAYVVKSPGGGIVFTVSHDKKGGTLAYRVQSGATIVLESSALGITTSRGDFTGGLAFVSQARRLVDETYRLPVGKRSTYLNRANELELVFAKGGQEMRLVLRAYDDGIAFRYQVPGSGSLEISKEGTTFALGGSQVGYWGQAHPNDYGYESPLGPLTAERLSMPVLAELKDRKHFLLVAQAGSYQDYVIPNYQREGTVLHLRFPLDQREPVKTTLPFASPWRFAIVSPGDVGRIVESTLVENLNPPTEPELGGRELDPARPRELGLHRGGRGPPGDVDRLRRAHGLGMARGRRGLGPRARHRGGRRLRQGAQGRDHGLGQGRQPDLPQHARERRGLDGQARATRSSRGARARAGSWAGSRRRRAPPASP